MQHPFHHNARPIGKLPNRVLLRCRWPSLALLAVLTAARLVVSDETVVTAGASAIQPTQPTGPASFADIVDHVKGAVVSVKVTVRDDASGQSNQDLGQGHPFEGGGWDEVSVEESDGQGVGLDRGEAGPDRLHFH